jgi:hypothetical protein
VVRKLAVSFAAVALAGCADAHGPRQQTVVSGREWRSNVAIILRQLRQDIAATQIDGGTPAAARAALRDESSLYGLLVSYSDFAGCREMVAAAGTTPSSAAHVDRLLIAGCSHLERASGLFTRAVRRDDGASLLAAGRESGRALPPLVRASAALGASR